MIPLEKEDKKRKKTQYSIYEVDVDGSLHFVSEGFQSTKEAKESLGSGEEGEYVVVNIRNRVTVKSEKRLVVTVE